MPLPLVPLAMAGASLVGGVFNSIGQSSANRANLAIAERQNALNYKMFKEQNEINEKYWHLNNAYNTPLAQRRRYEQAGINPALALGNISSGTAQAMKSATPSPAVGATMANSMQGIGDGIANGVSNAVNAYMQEKQLQASIKLSEAQAKSVEIENEKRRERLDAQQSNLEAQTRFVEEQSNRIKELTPYELQKLSQDYFESVSREDLNKVNKALSEYNLNHIAPEQRKLVLANISASYATANKMYLDGLVSKEQALNLFEQRLTEIERRDGIKIHNKALPKILEAGLKNTNASTLSSLVSAKLGLKQGEYLGQQNARAWFDSSVNGIYRLGELGLRGYTAYTTNGASEVVGNALGSFGGQNIVYTPTRR